METENQQTKVSHELAIALIQKDMDYLRKSMDAVTLTLATMDRDFARRSDLAPFTETLKNINTALEKKANHEDLAAVHKTLDTKVNVVEFQPIQKMLSRINWVLISSVVAGVLALLYNAGAK